MKQNGIYSILIAFFALTLVSSGILSTKTVQSLNDGPNAGEITNVLAGWQNMRYLLDKTTSDAIYDTVLANGSCTLSGDFQNNIVSYYTQIVDSISKTPSCNALNTTVSVDSVNSKVNAVFDLKCSTNIQNKLTVEFSDNISLTKTVELNAGPPCTIKVKDNDSGNYDIQ